MKSKYYDPTNGGTKKEGTIGKIVTTVFMVGVLASLVAVVALKPHPPAQQVEATTPRAPIALVPPPPVSSFDKMTKAEQLHVQCTRLKNRDFTVKMTENERADLIALCNQYDAY